MVTPNNAEKYIQELNKLEYERDGKRDSLKTDLQQMRLELTSLRKQVDSLITTSD